MITLYQHPLSGHSHRVRLLLCLLDIDAKIVDVDLMAGDHKQPGFLAKNPAGEVPVVEDGHTTLADSNAILIYLASKYDETHQWYPEDLEARAAIQQFLSLAAGPVAYGPASARLVNVFGAGLDITRAQTVAHTLLSRINSHLADRDWLVGKTATIADIANYAYIAHAPEGDVSLDDYPNIKRWLNNIERLNRFEPMQKTAVGIAA